MVILAGCGPQATSDDQYISICSDEWPISETACQQIVRASRVCPDGDRNDFLIVAQSSYALGDFSLDEAVDNAEQSICPAVEVDAEASPTTTRQSTDSGGGLDLVMAGWLTVCTDVPYPPMELKDPSAEGGFTGFDIELMRAIANDLGLDLAIATPGWDAIISGLATEAGDCDISAAAITLDESRRGIDFSEPYFENRQSLLVADDSTAATLADLDIVAAANGDYGEFWLRYNTPAGVNVVVFDDIGAMYLAFEAGEVDGVVTSIIGNQGFAGDWGGKLIESYASDEFLGFAVREEGAEALLAAVNESLAKLRGDGTYAAIYAEFFPGV